MSTLQASGPLLDPSTRRSARLIEIFRSQAPIDLEQLVLAIAGGEPSTAQHKAHRIKGAALSFGARPLSDCAALLEAQARNGELPSEASLAELAVLLERTLAAIEAA